MAGSPLKRHRKLEAAQAEKAKALREKKAKRIAGKPKPAPGTKQTSGSEYIRTDKPGRRMDMPQGGYLIVGGTNKGGTGRPAKAIQESFAKLVGRAGRERLAEILLARPRKLPVYDANGKRIGTQLATQPVKNDKGEIIGYLALPTKDDTVIRAIETAARIAGLTHKMEHAPDTADLPPLHIGVDPKLADDTDP